MKQSLEYSKEGSSNLDIFFNNEINFYVEDKGKEYRYQTILEELFDIKIERVVGLGGKNNLKQKFKQLEQESKLNNSFFIVDLDFDYLLEKEVIENSHFIYLEKYEIENYIIDENAIVRFLKNQLCCMKSYAKKRLDYKNWIERTNNELYELFILYLIVQDNSIKLENTNQNSNIFFNEEGNVTTIKIEEYYKKVKKVLDEKGYNIDDMIKDMKNKVLKMYNNDLSKVIKGKYILTGIRKYLSDIIKKETGKNQSINEKQLEDFLYEFFAKDNLTFIKERVYTIYK